MAPKRKEKSSGDTSAAAERVVRRSPRLANATPTPPTTVPGPPKKKKAKTTAASTSADTKHPSPANGSAKTIVIEHCKQCNSFKTRAAQVKEGLVKGVEEINVLVNPEKPRKGCFEVREEGGEVFISLLEMKRPFQPMRDLDMEKVISDIVDKIK